MCLRMAPRQPVPQRATSPTEESEETPIKIELKPGLRIRVKGLAHSKEMNDLEGNLLQFDATKDRWGVELENGKKVMLRMGNIVPFAAEVDPIRAGDQHHKIAMISHDPHTMRAEFFQAAKRFDYHDMMAIEKVYDTVVARLVQEGVPVQQCLAQLCTNEEAFDQAFGSAMAPFTPGFA